MNAIQQAFKQAGIKRSMFRNCPGNLPLHKILPPSKPLVIQVQRRSIIDRFGRVHLVDTKFPSICKVSHIAGIGRNKQAITEGGDIWSFRDQGNGFLVGVE